MRAGRLSHKVDVEHYLIGSPQRTPSGEENGAWTVLHNDIWAEWTTLSGNALFAAQQHHAEVRGIWRIRWRDGITAAMRILHNGLYYHILYVPPYDRQGKRVDMELHTSEGVVSADS